MPDQPARPLVIGHRGAPGYRPEHTESCYRLAFELGADAVEPDIVSTSDGVLVVRHENEISGTTDVSERREFRDRRTTKTVDGVRLTGWFTEDFTWEELSTLRCRERMPRLRSENVVFDDSERILSLRDVLEIVDEESVRHGRDFKVVVEIKHARYFRELGLDLIDMLLEDLAVTGWDCKADRLIFECFELGALGQLQSAGAEGEYIFLIEQVGAPADEPRRRGHRFAWYRKNAGLRFLAKRVDGISVAKANVMRVGPFGRARKPSSLVRRARARGLKVYTWTLRPENRYLNPRFRSSRSQAAWGDWLGEFDLVLGSGVDGIFVDQPDLGRAAVSQLRGTRRRGSAA